jgi:DNA-binding IclR family transcriptional regulator
MARRGLEPGRPDLYVVLRILDALARNSNRLSRSALQRDAGLNYTLFVRYLELLERRDLVKLDSAASLVELTSRGLEAKRYLQGGLERLLGEIGPSVSDDVTP